MSPIEPASASRYTRRQLLAMAGGAFVVGITPAAFRRRILVRRSIPVMGTVASVLVAHERRDAAEAAIDIGFDRLRWVDRMMTRFNATSDVGRVNRYASDRAIAVHPATAGVVAQALRWAERTGGEFDPALGRVMEVWDPAHRTRPPSAAAYARLSGRSLYRAVTLDRWRGGDVVRLDSSDLALDLGGIGKGYAVDLAVGAMVEAGITDLVVDAGGDLRALGRAADGDRWRVGVRSPSDPDRLVAELELAPGGEAIATSGDYVQGFVHRGHRYHHIMDPARAAPRHAVTHSLTIRSDTCLEADVLATAGFGRSAADVAALVGRAAHTARVAHVI